MEWSHSFRHDSRMDYKAEINKVTRRWSGTAAIPSNLFPHNVTRFNVFAVHSQVGKDKKV